jgi:hypothetical protein
MQQLGNIAGLVGIGSESSIIPSKHTSAFEFQLIHLSKAADKRADKQPERGIDKHCWQQPSCAQTLHATIKWGLWPLNMNFPAGVA